MARTSKIGGPAGLGGSKQTGLAGLGSTKKPSRMPAKGSSLHNSSGAGNQGAAAAPSGRKSNPSRHRKNQQGDQSEDSGNIRRTKEFKTLMGTLNGKAGARKVSNTGKFGQPFGTQNDVEKV
jgi:hypothetical protein